MKCNKCDSELEANAVFCNQCGAKVEILPQKIQCECGNELSTEAKFCGKCGAKAEVKVAQSWENKELLQEKVLPNNQPIENPTRVSLRGMLKEKHTDILGLNLSATFWITGLRVASFIGMFAIVILGIYQWVQLSDFEQGGLGLIIFLICAIAGFLCVAATMVFLDMAEDIRTMRKTMKK